MTTVPSAEGLTPRTFYDVACAALLDPNRDVVFDDAHYLTGDVVLTPETTGLGGDTPGRFRLGDYHSWETRHTSSGEAAARERLKNRQTILGIQLELPPTQKDRSLPLGKLPRYAVFRPEDLRPLPTPIGGLFFEYQSKWGACRPPLLGSNLPPRSEWGNPIIVESRTKEHTIIAAPESNLQIVRLFEALGGVALP